MATYRGLVHTLQIRDDGWVEVIIQAVHAGNATQSFFIKDLDGDISVAHKRLGQLSLLRDAVARILPVEIDYEDDPEQGRIIAEVTVHPRPSIIGNEMVNRVTGVVIGISITELGPQSGTTPYLDAADRAGITLLKEDGSVSFYLLDLQRTEKLTMHAMLVLLQMAHTTRRPVELMISVREINKPRSTGRATQGTQEAGYILSCQWMTVIEEVLDYTYAFIERLGQRYESFEESEAYAISHMKVVYTTSPAQTPEGDISENGSFIPTTKIAWIHDNAPMIKLLNTALKKRLQVKLGLKDEIIHEVEAISHLGSAARPVWVCVKHSYCDGHSGKECNNVPTIGLPSKNSLENAPVSLTWKAQGYFNKGIWRFHITTPTDYELKVDGKFPCCLAKCKESCECNRKSDDSNQEMPNEHLFLTGMHTIELKLHGYRHSQPFDLQIYRIR